MSSLSLRRRALLWMTLLLTGVGLSAIVIAYGLTLQEADEFLDGQLRQVALNAGLGVRDTDAPPASDPDPEDQIAVTVWRGDRRVRSDFSRADVAGPPRPGYADLAMQGRMWRAYTTRRVDWTVQAAQRETVRTEYARAAAIGAAAPILIVIPLSWLVLGWAIDRALARLRALARDIGTQSAAAAGPLPLDGVPAELVPLVDSMNGLIARLREAIEAQRRFVSDAAHELRTPLAAMQIQVSNLGTGDRDAAAAREALAMGVMRAGRLVNQLLRLARLEEPRPMPGAKVDVGAVVLDCVGEQALLAQEKEIDLDVNIDAPARLLGIETEIRVLVTNLLDNALRYSSPGGAVQVRLHRSEDGRDMLEILDTGPGLPSGSEHLIFERFHRAAPADVEGTGLGLAIAKRVAERHGLALTVENRRDGRTGVLARVVLPPWPAIAS